MCCLVLRSNFALLLTIQFVLLISSLINIISLLLTTFDWTKVRGIAPRSHTGRPRTCLVGFYNPCRLGTEMVALVRVIRLVHILLPVPYTPRVALYIHVSATSIAWMVWHCGWASAHMSSDWCYPLCALVTLVLRLIGFGNPCRLGTEMVTLVRVIRLVHILLPVHYTPRVALYIHVSATSIAWMVWHCGWASAHKSSDWCYPLCALVTLVLRLIGFYNPCRLGTEMVALVRVIRLVRILLPVPYTPRVARVR